MGGIFASMRRIRYNWCFLSVIFSMHLIRSFTQLRPHHRGCVATIGNFDGVHRGHQILFQQLRDKARAYQLPSLAITFEPQPEEFFQAHNAPARLTRLREKVMALRPLGIERLLCLRFNQALVNMPAQDFIREILVAGLHVRHLIVGDDFRFGHQRRGNFQTLQQAGALYGFDVSDTPTVAYGNDRISSTRIRAALERGELELAAQLLGRRYRLSGRVAHGDKRGRSIGFPTANVKLHRRTSPLSGVFTVHVHGVADKPWAGVANLGKRPTVAGTHMLLETHLFDFSGDIYGCHVEVEFLHKLREERRFPSFEALRLQIQCDAMQARVLLGLPPA
jgi:riboflavin kinase / FMN adenylyltransferase